jgi:hypothetical protein
MNHIVASAVSTARIQPNASDRATGLQRSCNVALHLHDQHLPQSFANASQPATVTKQAPPTVAVIGQLTATLLQRVRHTAKVQSTLSITS